QTVGYDPEGVLRIATLDRGSRAGIQLDDAVINGDGAVGRVVEVTPFFSKVLLIVDPSSKLPVLVQKGRWWGIAAGTGGRLEMQYVAQDAKLRIGQTIVTGAGRSFRSGITVGRIAAIFRPEGALYQTALVEPAVRFGRLGPVLVLRR
ncbi:MAG TPA: rod shape-determining protein MreC, partial [Candidatus Baltobacteraceae bacterium]|nr:rod shape-determining protein MreC [Candidatus Baltobacteraceae bacterium]